MKIFAAIAILLLAAAGLMAQTASEPTAFGEWAVLTNCPMIGMALRARLVISEAAGDSGSRTVLAYIELQNTNNSVNTLLVRGNPQLRCELRDSNGRTVSPALSPIRSGLLQGSFWLALPYDSIVRFRPYPPAPRVVTNGGLAIDGGGYWKFPRGDTNDYYLSGTLTLRIPNSETPPVSLYPAGDGTFRSEDESDNICHGTLQLPAVKIPASVVTPSQVDAVADEAFAARIAEVWLDCQRLQPGMTRADLDKMFKRDTGGVAVPDSTPLPFREHQTFDYRRCNGIMIDVDFRPSGAKEEQPTDVIIKVSKPYLDAAPRI